MTIAIPPMQSPKTEDLVRLAGAVGAPLPHSYLSFVKLHDGAEPQSNVIDVGQDNEAGVRQFIPVGNAPSVLSDVDGFPQGMIPFAEDESGNFFYMAPANGQVFFWDHELDDTDQLLAADLDSFLARLRPFDAASVKLAPGQVKSVWVHPDFKPEF